MSALSHKHVSAILERHQLHEIRKIGEGSFGNAILVETPSGAKRVCKMIDVSHASFKEAENAVKEAKLLSTMKHPYIVRYRQSFADEGWLCILMDFCEGGELAQRIEAARRVKEVLPEDKVLRWFTQAMLALKHLHDRHILHRDLKPSNFFLTKEEVLRVGDFGVAKVLSNTTACARTQIGTPYYLSPEVCQEQPYACPSDVWAMGCILYEMCARRVPFEAKSISQLVERICRGATPVIPAGYSEEVRQLCRHLLVRDPASRPSVDKVLRRPEIQVVIRRMLEERRREAVAEKDTPPVDAPRLRSASRSTPKLTAEPSLPGAVAGPAEPLSIAEAPKQDFQRLMRMDDALEGEIRRNRTFSDGLDSMPGGASSSRSRGLGTAAAVAAPTSQHATPRLAALPAQAARRPFSGIGDEFAMAMARSSSTDQVAMCASAASSADAICGDLGGLLREPVGAGGPGPGGLFGSNAPSFQPAPSQPPPAAGPQAPPRPGLHRSASAVAAAAGDVLAPRARVPEVRGSGQRSKGYTPQFGRPSPPIMVAAAAAVASGAASNFPSTGVSSRSLRPISAAGVAILGAA